MTHWEFLIQKEGDRTWLPIQTKLEIEAGKYRVVTHSDRANTHVEIRVTHQPSGDSHQYSRRTNSEGLLMVLPFTDLAPGIWELRCCGDILADLLGYPWQEQVQLHVLSKLDIEKKSLNQPANDEEESRSSITVSSSSNKAEFYRQQLEQLLRQEIEPLLQFSAVTNLAQNLQLSLEQDTFIRSQGESLSIVGQIEYLGLAQPSNSAFTGRLRYELCEPKTGRILLNIEQPLPCQTLPSVFHYYLEIPNECEMPFLIGEVILEAIFKESQGNQEVVILARQPFTITTELMPLLLETENDFFHTLKSLLELEKNSSPLHLDLPEPTKMAKTLQLFSLTSEQILPPRIARSSATEKDAKPLQLPKFSPPPSSVNITSEPTV